MRVLVSSTGGAGHFGPLVPFVEALVRRRDEVLVIVPPALTTRVQAMGRPFRIAAGPPVEELGAIWDRVSSASPQDAAALVNREIFGRLDTAAMLPTVDEALRDWRPDVLLHEPAEYASAVAGEASGVPHVQVAIGLAGVEASSLALAAPALEPYNSGIVDRIRASPYLTRLPAQLDPSPYVDTRRFREAADQSHRRLPDVLGGHDGPLADGPLVYVSFGSVVGALPIGLAAYRAAVEAVAGLPVRVLLTMGHARDPAELGQLPANVHVESWVRQVDVLRQASVVVCHGGAGTTFGALAAGVPLVVVPLMADQPANARLVSKSGAGIEIDTRRSFGDGLRMVGPAEAPRIRAAIEQVLADGSYRRAAARIASEMKLMPAIDDVLAELSGQGSQR